VRIVYSPLDALKIARAHPDKEVVFFALGFETTMPSTAFTALQAEREGIRNFSLLCNHITIIATIKAILDSPELTLDGFLGPGHVSMVIGTAPYRFIAEHYRKPIVVAGFEPLDILQSIAMVLRQLAEERCVVENQYRRIVPESGNGPGLAAISRLFELREFFEWRGLGSIDHSGVRVREAYARYDAERKFSLPGLKIADPKACRCGEVLKGVIKPWQCKVFGGACTPETPLGALMVSSEGACAAYYNYGGARVVERRAAIPRRPNDRPPHRPQGARHAHHLGARERRQGDARSDRGCVRRHFRQHHLRPARRSGATAPRRAGRAG
jgi:hydrogenase expression/formation protein HypD